MYYYGGGLVSLLVLILDIYCIVKIVGSSMDVGMKLVWALVVIIFPVIGAILFLLLADGGSRV